MMEALPHTFDQLPDNVVCALIGKPPLVIIESPYAGEIDANVVYARAAMRDSLNRREAPIASHLLYTQPGILRDEIPSERQWGIDAGLAWREVADLAAFYIDRGWSGGMLAAREIYEREGRRFEIRSIASAGEARRAETPQDGSVHEGAGPQDIAQEEVPGSDMGKGE